MIGELGQLALCLALALMLMQVAVNFIGAARNDEVLMAAGRSVALGGFVFIALAFGALIIAFVVSDFSVMTVAENSHTAKPLLYKISGTWGNHEGSMLLWLFILGGYGAAMALTQAGGALLTARALAVQALLAVAFLAFVLLTSDPFQRVYPPPFEGAGLNPLLQDPGLAFHPPLLYLGYVGLSAAFSYAAAALIGGENDARWVHAARPFALGAWSALTLGIALGSWWSYYTLGWGGFWFWDPVENASLLPWLMGAALIHSMMATARTGAFKSWTLLLAIGAFSMSLIGTFLVRSGVLTSVHSFASNPARGIFILIILVLAIGAALALFAWRAPRLRAGAPFEVVSRESAILMNNLLLTVAMVAVFVGTLYPLALEAITGAKISVGPPYFSITFMPLAAVLALILPFGPLLSWRRDRLIPAVRSLRIAFGVTLVATLAAIAVISPKFLVGFIALGLGTWLIMGALTDLARRAGSWRGLRLLPRGAWSAVLAHAGVGIIAFGIAGATAWKSEGIEVLAPGGTMSVAGYTLRFDGVEDVLGPNYTAQRATVTVSRNGKFIARMAPEKRNFPVEGQVITDAAIRTTILSDLYIVLGDARDNGRFVLRVYVNPLAPFIWFGAALIALGGVLGLLARLHERRMVPKGAAVVAI
jgi:cytochrome c-type biogenesis protein CcmF